MSLYVLLYLLYTFSLSLSLSLSLYIYNFFLILCAFPMNDASFPNQVSFVRKISWNLPFFNGASSEGGTFREQI